MQNITENISQNEALFTWQKLLMYVEGKIGLAELEGLDEEQISTIAEIGYALMEQGRTDEARKLYEGLIEMAPVDPYFHSVLGAIYQRMNDNEKSLQEYDIALKLNPSDLPALVNSGEVMLHSGRIIEALERLKAAIAIDKEGSDPWALRAMALVAIIGNILKEKARA